MAARLCHACGRRLRRHVERCPGCGALVTSIAAEQWRIPSADPDTVARARQRIAEANRFGREGRYAEAASEVERALELLATDARIHAHRAWALLKLGDLDLAMAACDAALALDPARYEAHCYRAGMLSRRGEFAEAPSLPFAAAVPPLLAVCR